MQDKSKCSRREPYLWEALLVVFLLMVIVSYSLVVLKADPQIPFVIVLIVTSLIAMRSGVTWRELENSIVGAIASVMSAVLILIVVGLVIGAWIQGGIVPSLIYYGLKIIDPRYFLVTIYLVCSIVSISTGTSWTTVGTLGVAAMGISEGLGIPLHITAGTVIAASYLGDKISPLSDTSNLEAAIVNVDLFEHVKHMLYTTIPAFVICLGLYAYLGFKYAPAHDVALDKITLITTTLSDNFLIHPLFILPVLMVVPMIAFKFPALPGITCMALMGCVCAVAFQGATLGEVVQTLHYGFEATTGVEAVDELLTRGGMDSMMWTVSLIISAVAFGGVLEGSGILKVLIARMLKFVKSDGTLIMLSVLSCIVLNIIAVDNYVAMVITGKMFREAYVTRGLDPLNLARCLADGAAITSPLIPWNTCGVVMYGMIGITAAEYGPYVLLGWVTPIITVIFGYLGIGTKKLDSVSVKEVYVELIPK